MIIGLDTSVVVRVLTGEPRDLALVALDYLQRRLKAGDRVLVSDWVIAETYYALPHHYGASKKDTLNALRDFLASVGLVLSGLAICKTGIHRSRDPPQLSPPGRRGSGNVRESRRQASSSARSRAMTRASL